MKNNKIFKIIIIVVIIIIIGFIGYNCYKNLRGNENVTKKEIKKEVFDEKELNNIISYIPYSNATIGLYKDAYNGELTIINDVISMAYISSITGKLRESYSFKDNNKSYTDLLLKEQGLKNVLVYEVSFVNEQLAKKYNITLNSYDVPDDIKIYYLNNELVVIQNDTTDISKQAKISLDGNFYESNGEIIYNEKAVFAVFKDNKYYIYENSSIKGEPIKTYDYNNRTLNEIASVIREDFKDYKTTFKHTFRKNELGYYWYSTEMVN